MIKRIALLILTSGCVLSLGMNCLPNIGVPINIVG